MGLKKATVVLGADISQFTSKMKKASRSFKKMGKSMKRIGSTMSRTISGPIALLGVGSVIAAANFEKSMNKVKAVTGATGKEFTKLTKQAKDLGKTTQFSASQAAEAMGFLGMAGFNTSQIMAAMPATLDLAAAGSMDLARAADISSNILQGFGADANEMGRFADVLAKGFTTANTNLEELGQGMAKVAPVADGLGISFEETTAAIGLLSNAGIKGESAGAALNQVFGIMSKKAHELGITVFDASGKMKPLHENLDQIKKSGIGSEKILEIFGVRAGPAMMTLLKQGGDALKNYTADLKDSGGTAKKVAETQMEGLAGTLTRLKSATEGVAIQFGEMLLPILEKLATKVSKALTFISNMSAKAKTITIVIAGLLAVLGPTVALLGTMATVIGASGAAFALMASPIGIIIGLVGVLATGIINLNQN